PLVTACCCAREWEAWVGVWLAVVSTIVERAVAAARGLFALIASGRRRVLAASTASVMSVRLFELLPQHPIVTIPGVVRLLDTTKPTAAKAVGVLTDLGILVETTGRRRDRTFGYRTYLDRLRVGTELEEGGRYANLDPLGGP